MKNKNRYKKLREDYKENHNQELTQEKLAEIFKSKGYDTLNHTAIRKIETDKRNLSTYELKGYCEVFNTTSDYLLGIDDVQRKSPDMSMISRVTGLNDASIACLRILNENETSSFAIPTLNTLMSDYRLFFALIHNIDIMMNPSSWIPGVGTFVTNGNNGYSRGSYRNFTSLKGNECLVFAKTDKNNELVFGLDIDASTLQSQAFLNIKEIIDDYKKKER